MKPISAILQVPARDELSPEGLHLLRLLQLEPGDYLLCRDGRVTLRRELGTCTGAVQDCLSAGALIEVKRPAIGKVLQLVQGLAAPVLDRVEQAASQSSAQREGRKS